MTRRRARILALALAAVLLSAGYGTHSVWAVENIDLSHAQVAVVAGKPVVEKAAVMLREEIQKRTGLKLEQVSAIPAEPSVTIALAVQGAIPKTWGDVPAGIAVPDKPDGFAIGVDTAARKAATVWLVGHDERGALFAAGRLLRALQMTKGAVGLPSDTKTATAPHDAVRGHQLCYGAQNNTYDAWSIEQYEQCFRDLIVFGTNCVELVPEFDTPARNAVHMKIPPAEMMLKVANLAHSYGLTIWTFVALNGDVSDPALAQKELDRCAAFFKMMPFLDAVFVPGGDPGETPPQGLMPFLAKLSERLRQFHPKSELWVSNQAFEDAQNDYFFSYLEKEKPSWLTGVVYGPWAKLTMKEERERTPKQYHVRSYPDIGHSVRCQHPVPHWDRALAHTLGRECANPRPRAQAAIHHGELPYSEGFVSYSEGINDDVNKVIWSAFAWDPNTTVEDVLRDYGRYFIGEDIGPAVGEGLIAEEKGWEGPLKDNSIVTDTYKKWKELEKKAGDRAQRNWRFQQGLLRAYYDEYDKQRLAVESEREANAYAELKKAEAVGSEAAISGARKALLANTAQPELVELRRRIEEIGAGIYANIGAQLSVKEPMRASGAERGAVLDFLDRPLNDAPWLEKQFAEILSEKDKAVQLKRIAELLSWENPGPGSYYDDLGNATKQPHLVSNVAWVDDPGFVHSPQDEFSGNPALPQDKSLGEPAAVARSTMAVRLSWLDQGQTLFREPLRMHYEHLDPAATYKVRVTYAGRFKSTMKLIANDTLEIHGPLAQPDPIAPKEFAISQDATRKGTLDLRWEKTAGRGCQVAEVWLLKQ